MLCSDEQVLMCTVRVLSVGAVIFYVTPILITIAPRNHCIFL